MTDEEFRNAMASLPPPPSDSQSPYWDYWRRNLWERAQADPPDRFTSWPCVYHTMLVDHFDMSEPLAYVSDDGNNRWHDAIAHSDSSIRLALLEQAHHLKRWEAMTGKRVESLRSIYEFGGGFGAMALVVYRLGFRGDYMIYDLHEFALLQRWFLGRLDIPVTHIDDPARSDLFIAAYSISETPLDFRDEFMEKTEAGSYLFLYSSQFNGYDNSAYFADLTRREKRNWHAVSFPGRQDWYLIA